MKRASLVHDLRSRAKKLNAFENQVNLDPKFVYPHKNLRGVLVIKNLKTAKGDNCYVTQMIAFDLM